MIGWYIFRTMT